MPCLRPIDVPVRSGDKKGHSFLVPCGKCDECTNRRKMAFVLRCEHERRYGNWKYCHYVTLSYCDKYLPYQSYSIKRKGSPVDPIETGESLLCPYDLTQFFKRYRLLVDDKIKYFCAGEYGSKEKTHRPHYHIILFCNQNWKECVRNSELAWSYLVAETKEDRKKRYRKSKKQNKTIKRDSHSMRNRELIGRVNVLSVFYKRICYVAKYCNKRLFADEVVKPFVRLSNGLGAGFLESETAKICARDNRHHTFFENGLPVAIPRYYSHRLFNQEQMDAFSLSLIKQSNPPDSMLLTVYKPMYDPIDGVEQDFFVAQHEFDNKQVFEWYKQYNLELQRLTKRARLARYGITRYYV